ncbi:uracil-DNA glycosylase family 4 [Sulfuritortus calidifontis]|uniref:Type-5 uracil-DNA glycosylase n=2 Tax=Sulfuritortus calidifontis TaxID=1914471 RepID=A0A4R3K0G6_9PROT|nr:uracil-DNA glycosylase family 4 [Sulfuritortus calidifontis]
MFDPNCTACPRLADFLADCRASRPDYYGRPVPPFGAAKPRLLIVGLAPGYHGANRSGRPFTGDYAGVLLYQTLHAFGYASRPESTAADDGLELIGCRITNAVKCVPPENKPTPDEIRRCNGYLKAELEALPKGAAILALGQIAHGAVLRALGLKLKDYPFGHAAVHQLPSPSGRGVGGEGKPRGEGKAEDAGTPLRLYDSYHCSRYNTQTRRLTPEMFQAVFAQIRKDREEA